MRAAETLIRLAVLAIFVAGPVRAEDNVLLIQQGPEGFHVWHTEGVSLLSDDEVLDLMATARPEGGEEMPTPLGPARAYEREAGIEIRLLAATRDKALLVDRDACGHIHLWHAEGPTQLSDNDLFELVHSARPEGGPRLRLGDRYAKAFFGKLGVTATLWAVPAAK